MPLCFVPMAPCWRWCCGRRSSSTAATRWGSASALRLAVVAALLSLLPFVAWTVRNWHTFHVFQPLAPRYANDPGEFASPGFVRWVRTLTADFTSTSEIYWNGNSDRIDPGNLPARAIDNAEPIPGDPAPPAGLQRHHHPDARARRPLCPAGPGAHPRPSLSLLRQPAPAAAGRHVASPAGGDAERPPALVAVCPASRGDAGGSLLRRAEPGLSGGGFSGRPPLAAAGGLHGGADRPAQPVAGHPRGARIALYPGMFSAADRAGCLLLHDRG